RRCAEIFVFDMNRAAPRIEYTLRCLRLQQIIERFQSGPAKTHRHAVPQYSKDISPDNAAVFYIFAPRQPAAVPADELFRIIISEIAELIYIFTYQRQMFYIK